MRRVSHGLAAGRAAFAVTPERAFRGSISGQSAAFRLPWSEMGTGSDPRFRRSEPVLFGGAEGIRTPDLLIANETRYQLRHSPIAPEMNPARAEKISLRRGSNRIRQEPTARWSSCSVATSSSAAAAASTSLESASERPEVQVPGSLRSMVRTVRAARGLLT